MSGLVEVLAAHRNPGECLYWDDEAWIICTCEERIDVPVRDGMLSQREAKRLLDEHVAAAILAHLRAVAAGEGVRWSVATGIADADPDLGGYPGDWLHEADVALTAFLDHLDHGRAGDAGEGER